MMNAVNTTQRMRRKERHKFSRTMAVILGLIVTLEVMVAGGMIFNINFSGFPGYFSCMSSFSIKNSAGKVAFNNVIHIRGKLGGRNQPVLI